MTHTPYDGSARPFTIGLRPLDIAEWIDADCNFETYIAEKKRLYTTETQSVLVAEAGTEDAQAEVHELVRAHLKLTPGPGRDAGISQGALADAALLVQEDLVLMRQSPQGWRLVAGSVCFPSSWNLREKFGQPLHAVHGPVPGFNSGTRNASMIERIFDSLRAEHPVMRWNWSLYGEAVLYHPAAENQKERRFGEGSIAGRVTLRLERQTLRKLPRSGDILFTIRIYMDPLEVLEMHAEGAQLAHAIIEQLTDMSANELDYKGLTEERPRLIERLRQIS